MNVLSIGILTVVDGVSMKATEIGLLFRCCVALNILSGSIRSALRIILEALYVSQVRKNSPHRLSLIADTVNSFQGLRMQSSNE